MRLIFEVQIDEKDNIYIDQDSVDSEFEGSWFKAMSWLIDEEGICSLGLDEDLKLVEVTSDRKG